MGRISLELSIHTFHIDFSRHVSNIVYVQWVEIARLKIMEVAGMPVPRMAERGIIPVLTETHIRYISPLHLGHSVTVEVWITELKQASAWMEFRFTNQEGEVVAEARQRGLFVVRETGRPYRLTADERALFEPYLGP